MSKRKQMMSALLMGLALVCSAMAGAKGVKVPPGGKAISPELLGIFIEEIGWSGDGGLNGECIRNGSFEFAPRDEDGYGPGTAWGMTRPGHATGYIEPRYDAPLNPRNPTYMRLVAESTIRHSDFTTHAGVGIYNGGFDTMEVRAGVPLHFSAFMRVPDGGAPRKMQVYVTENGSDDQVLAQQEIVVAGDWKKYEAVLTTTKTAAPVDLTLLLTEPGAVDVDMVSLIPGDTYKGHGNRADLAQALADLKPKFVRFPGGCVIHGGAEGLWNTYQWKNSIGPREQRVGTKNMWGSHMTMNQGFYEYFQFCEDIGAEPLPVLPMGISCQGAGGCWALPEQGQEAVPMEQMDKYAQDALDLIEWANGDTTTTWGRLRAQAGHPEPFNMKYLGFGNEEKISPEFEERFSYLFNRVRAAYPHIKIVGTVGVDSYGTNPEYLKGWVIADSLGVDIIDEHHYPDKSWYLDNLHKYDAYPRDRKSKVYIGEYSSMGTTMANALAEGLYLLAAERNGDVVAMTSYAPLMCKRGHDKWNPNLIYFDSRRIYPTVSYYVQKMFGNTPGHYYYGDVAKFAPAPAAAAAVDGRLLGASCVLNTDCNAVYVKFINGTAEEREVEIDLSRFGRLAKQGVLTTIAAATGETVNDYDAQPVSDVATPVKLAKRMKLTAAPFSASALSVPLR